MTTVTEAKSDEDICHIRALFLDYSNSLGFELDFQHFDSEVENLPGEYSPPDGCLLLAHCDGELAGCIAMRKISGDICEMKRLYVRPSFRSKGVGRLLSESLIERARDHGYKSMRLDTLESMKEATSLYRSLGFADTDPYRYNPLEGATYLELPL